MAFHYKDNPKIKLSHSLALFNLFREVIQIIFMNPTWFNHFKCHLVAFN